MLGNLARAVFERASQSPAGRRLAVLIYHRVTPLPDPLLPYEPDAEAFERTMRWVGTTFNVLPLEQAVRDLKAGNLPPRAMSITFDDGYENNATVAAPILEGLGLHATFFIATGYLDGGLMFNDAVVEAVRACPGTELDLTSLNLGQHRVGSVDERRATIDAILNVIKYHDERERADMARAIAESARVELPRNLMMTSEQAAALARAGFALGAHTVSHPILAKLDDHTARREIIDGKLRLEEISGGPVNLFAYPNGRPDRDYSGATTRFVREIGFDGAVSTSMGVAEVGSDPYQIPRFTPWDVRPLRFAAQLWSNFSRVEPSYATT